MLGENDFLFPIGQPFLRLKHWTDSGLQSDDVNFAAPRNNQGPPE
jgi:hypothetical protein